MKIERSWRAFIIAIATKYDPRQPKDEAGQWTRAEIGWPDGLWSRETTGIDAIQAFELALRLVGTQLYCSHLHAEGRLVWIERGFGYGFPVPVTIRDLLIGEDRKQFG